MVNLLYTQTKDGFIVAIDTDRLQSGMATGEGDSMAPDEMYLMLQADMISIKRQEQVLQSEIEEIASKFHQLLDTVDDPESTASGTMAPPSTPSFMKTTAASLTQVTKLETPTFMKQTTTTYCLSDSSEDESRSMFTDFVPNAIVNKSDGLPLDISILSSKTLVVDRNSNYLGSPHSECNDNDTPVIEAITSLDKTSPSTDSSSASSSSSSSHHMSSSDGYPKSDESTDNQVVPECYDLDKEFMSRLQYYSDFTVDRQKKINSIVTSCGGSLKDNSPCDVTEGLLARHVEGKESSPEKLPVFVKPMAPPPSASSGSDYLSTPSRHPGRRQQHRYRRTSRKSSSVPLANSTMLDDSFSSSSSGRASHQAHSLIPKASSTMIYESESSSGSSRRNRTGASRTSRTSNPRACSTMLNDSFISTASSGSSSSKHKSFPMANSTMIHELPAMIPCTGEPTVSIINNDTDVNQHSDFDCESVYTWSIHDGDSGSDQDISLEESYMKKVTNTPQKMCNKPPLPPCKRVRSASDRDSDSEHQCKDHQLHKLLGEPCSRTMIESISVIESSDTCREEALFVESMCDGDMTECALPKSNTLPRSSTRVKLQDKSSGSSSMDARRTSLPDLTSVCTSNNEETSMPQSYSEDEYTAMSERPDCQGKSSSSNDNPNAGATSQGSANMDSILTDSPNSVCSSGINAPYNSPGTNASSSSRVSVSTTSDARSSDSNINTRAPHVNLLPRNMPTPANSPKVQNINVATTSAAEGAFKVPKQTQPLRNLFRFRRNKSKTPEVKSSTPKVSNGQPLSKRQLFSSAGTVNLHSDAKVMDKKAVIRKFKKFSDSFRHRDRSGKPQIETLANL